MRLRELEPADAARCAELERVLFPGETPWTQEVFLGSFAQTYTFYFGAYTDAADAADAASAGPAGLVGYAGIAKLGPKGAPEFEVLTIGVDPRAQRQGIGRALMDNVCHIADLEDAPVFLEVRVGNDPAVALYEACGFIKTGIRRNYYQPSGADAHTMVRPRASERASAGAGE